MDFNPVHPKEENPKGITLPFPNPQEEGMKVALESAGRELPEIIHQIFYNIKDYPVDQQLKFIFPLQKAVTSVWDSSRDAKQKFEQSQIQNNDK